MITQAVQNEKHWMTCLGLAVFGPLMPPPRPGYDVLSVPLSVLEILYYIA